MRGEVFKYIRWRDRKNRAISSDQRAPKAGHSVMLTIDRRIQLLRLPSRYILQLQRHRAASAVPPRPYLRKSADDCACALLQGRLLSV